MRPLLDSFLSSPDLLELESDACFFLVALTCKVFRRWYMEPEGDRDAKCEKPMNA